MVLRNHLPASYLGIRNMKAGVGEKCTTFTKRIWIEHVDAESISVDEEINLMDWGNAIVKKIEKGKMGSSHS
jgi:hypothetical protein